MRFEVVSASDNVVLTMDADDADSIPTDFSDPTGRGRDKHARQLAEVSNANVKAIASRMGRYSTLRIAKDEPQEEVAKAVYRVTTEQTQQAAGFVMVEDGLLTGYAGPNPPMGYAEGKPFQEWQEEQRGLIAELVGEAEEIKPVDDKTSQAQIVGEAVGAALTATGLISKKDEERRMVFGWAYVTHDREGNVVVDKSGDFIDDITEIENSAYSFVSKSRAGDMDHTNLKSAEMIESMVFTPEKIEKMGIPPGTLPSGWWVGFHFPEDKDWEEAKKRTAFSIHGRGTRKSVD